jgi:hypothetical protein
MLEALSVHQPSRRFPKGVPPPAGKQTPTEGQAVLDLVVTP